MTKNKTTYVDGFVLTVPKKNVDAYRKMAKTAAKIWMKHGALDYKECMGDDLKPSTPTGVEGGADMKALTFPKMINAAKNETIWFSYITFKSRTHRDQVNKKVMAEMMKNADKWKDMPMPFDMQRMAYGGFKVSVSG